MSCGMLSRHEGLHHDPKRPGHYWEETFYAFEFEYGRPVKVATARKVRLCKRCEKEIRTDGANGSCVCKEIGATKRQAIMFADEREKTAREDMAADIQADIDWLILKQHRERNEMIAATEEPYYGAF